MTWRPVASALGGASAATLLAWAAANSDGGAAGSLDQSSTATPEATPISSATASPTPTPPAIMWQLAPCEGRYRAVYGLKPAEMPGLKIQEPKFVHYFPDRPDISDLDVLEYARGYFISVLEDCQLSFDDYRITLKGGRWNWVAWALPGAAASPPDGEPGLPIGEQLGSCAQWVRTVYGPPNPEGEALRYFPSRPQLSNLDHLSRGVGYVVLLMNGCSLTQKGIEFPVNAGWSFIGWVLP